MDFGSHGLFLDLFEMDKSEVDYVRIFQAAQNTFILNVSLVSPLDHGIGATADEV